MGAVRTTASSAMTSICASPDGNNATALTVPNVDYTKIIVELQSDSHMFIPIMYVSDWTVGRHKVVGSGKQISKEFHKDRNKDELQFRVTFAARLGAYCTDGGTNHYVSVLFDKPGFYVCNLTGNTAQHVRLKSVVDHEGHAADVSRHHFK